MEPTDQELAEALGRFMPQLPALKSERDATYAKIETHQKLLVVLRQFAGALDARIAIYECLLREDLTYEERLAQVVALLSPSHDQT